MLRSLELRGSKDTGTDKGCLLFDSRTSSCIQAVQVRNPEQDEKRQNVGMEISYSNESMNEVSKCTDKS